MTFFKRKQIEGRRSYDLFGTFKYYVPGGSGIFWLIIMFMLGGILGNLVTVGLSWMAGADFATSYGFLISYPVMFIPLLVFASSASRRNALTEPGVALDSNNFGKLHWWGAALLVTVATLAAAFAADALNALMPQMPQWLEDMLSTMLQGPLWATLLSVSIFAPLFEEWLCRGLVLRGLLQKINPAAAILVSALFFAVIHLNPWQAVPAFILGVLFGIVYYRTGSLKLTMLMHFVNNTFSTILSRIDSLKEVDSFSDIMSPAAYGVSLTVCIAVVIAIAFVFLRIPVKEGQRSNCDIIPATDWSKE
ncbi:MAG: lysostaphin resistance A-like protein [Candidatus Cryptobacteroides sp.]